MRMKTFIADNMQQALKQIREELGPDAVILSSRKLDHGTEVVGALNYDEEAERQQLTEQKKHQISAAEVARETVARQSRMTQEKADIKRQLEEARQRLSHAHGFDLPQRQADKVVTKPSVMVTEASPLATEPAEATNGLTEASKNMLELRAEITELRAILKQQVASVQDQQQDFSALFRAVNMPAQPMLPREADKSANRLESFPVELRNRFTSLGVLPDVQGQLLQNLEPGQELAVLWRKILANMAYGLSTPEKELIDGEGYIALLGPTGVGKTTTIAKLAARFVLKYGPQNIALVTTDRFKVAATQQLQSFGRLFNVPVLVVDEKQRLDDVLDRLSDKKLVLIDTAGLNPQDSNWELQCRDLQVERHRINNYLVLSAVTQAQVMKANYHHYKKLNICGCIISKVDEAVSLGEVISMAILNQLPVAYVTDGQQIPADLHHVKAHALVVRAVALAQKMATEINAGRTLIA